MEERILEILKDVQPLYEFEEGINFVEEGYLDSLDVVTLIGRLEEAYGIAISALEFIPENFVSLQAICALVNKSDKV